MLTYVMLIIQNKILKQEKLGRTFSLLFLAFLFSFSSGFVGNPSANKKNSTETPEQFKDVGIDEKLGKKFLLMTSILQMRVAKKLLLVSTLILIKKTSCINFCLL